MAKITPANADPDAVPHGLKELQIRDDPKWGLIAQRKPVGGPRETKLMRQYRTRFGFAARMASTPAPLELLTAMEMAKGTQQVPRDILTMAALGDYYVIEAPDGTTWPKVPGPVRPPDPEPEPEPEPEPGAPPEIDMQWPLWDQAWSTTFNSSTEATKGLTFTPRRSVQLTHIAAVLNAFADGTYRAHVGTYSSGRTIGAITTSADLSPAASGHQLLQWPLELELAADVEHFALVTRTDQGPTHALPIVTHLWPAWLWYCKHGDGVRIASTDPAVGNTLSLAYTNRACPIGLRLVEPA